MVPDGFLISPVPYDFNIIISYLHIYTFFPCSLYYLTKDSFFFFFCLFGFAFPQWSGSWIFISFKDIFLFYFISVVILLTFLFSLFLFVTIYEMLEF